MKSLYDLTLDYERFFGDPADEKNTFSFKRARQYDINSTFPEEFIRELNAWGLSEYYVPEAFGGNLKGYDELFNLIRLTSRRDLTAAIGHGKTMLGAICVWVGGSDTQRARLAESILRQDQVSLALTEHPHGSDISATDTLCSETEDGYLLNGEKYLINNARRSASLTVFARTSAKNNARDFSLFMVEKAGLPENALSYESQAADSRHQRRRHQRCAFSQCPAPRLFAGRPNRSGSGNHALRIPNQPHAVHRPLMRCW
ncbi:acyl-CoA dehydrogenase family protein [Rouxiella badensis]|nr:acyl-CoA dehydrogenase family protein [Rouxiella badensis]